MKNNKESLIIFFKTNNLSFKLYITAIVLYLVSLMVMSLIEYRPSFNLSKLIMSIVAGLVIMGNILSFLKKDKEDKSKYSNVVIAGIIFMYVFSEYFI